MQFAGTVQLAALGPTSVIFSFSSYVFNALGIATTSKVSGILGQGDPEKGSQYAAAALVIAIACGISSFMLLQVLLLPLHTMWFLWVLLLATSSKRSLLADVWGAAYCSYWCSARANTGSYIILKDQGFCATSPAFSNRSTKLPTSTKGLQITCSVSSSPGSDQQYWGCGNDYAAGHGGGRCCMGNGCCSVHGDAASYATALAKPCLLSVPVAALGYSKGLLVHLSSFGMSTNATACPYHMKVSMVSCGFEEYQGV